MAELAVQARRAHRAIVDDDRDLLADAMDRSFVLRAAMVEIPPLQQVLVDVGRRAGAAVNSAGSGGSVVGIARDEAHLEALRSAYAEAGAGFCDLGG